MVQSNIVSSGVIPEEVSLAGGLELFGKSNDDGLVSCWCWCQYRRKGEGGSDFGKIYDIVFGEGGDD